MDNEITASASMKLIGMRKSVLAEIAPDPVAGCFSITMTRYSLRPRRALSSAA